jgi:uncharacterized RDD family membrane protein YckC
VQLDNRVTFATPEGVTLELVLAGLGSRFLARLLDTVIQLALIFALAIGVGVSGSPGWAQAIGAVAMFLVIFAYDIILETLNNGRTIGKLAAGIRVVGRSGEPVRFLASAVRNIARIVDFLPALYLTGTISMIATQRSQRVGDLAAGTIVARERFPGLAHTPAPITVTADAVATWDVSAVNASELQAVRHFLDRRLELRWPARSYFASDLANRLGPKVAGIPANSHPEYVLEGIVVAKQGRT